MSGINIELSSVSERDGRAISLSPPPLFSLSLSFCLSLFFSIRALCRLRSPHAREFSSLLVQLCATLCSLSFMPT